MNTILLRNMQMRKSESLQSFKEYRQSESRNPQQVPLSLTLGNSRKDEACSLGLSYQRQWTRREDQQTCCAWLAVPLHLRIPSLARLSLVPTPLCCSCCY